MPTRLHGAAAQAVRGGENDGGSDKRPATKMPPATLQGGGYMDQSPINAKYENCGPYSVLRI